MNRYLITTAALALAGAVLAGSPAGAGTSSGVTGPSGAWGKAQEVPGITALDKGGDAVINSLSCASAGNCSAGGSYATNRKNLHEQAFVVSEVNGAWGNAQEVPGSAALNTGGSAEVNSVSCASAGNCTAGGDYTGKSEHSYAFVASEVHGTWRKAEKVPGLAALGKDRYSSAGPVSCASAGNCTAAGGYTDGSGATQVFVASQVNGTWGKAEQVPGLAALNKHGYALANQVSCAPAGNCSVGGFTNNDDFTSQAFVASQVHGTWRKAEIVPGTGPAGYDHIAETNAVSCTSAGNCMAGGDYGYYTPRASHGHAFVASQVHGTWRKAEQVPGLAALATAGDAEVDSVSCASAGNCGAGGYYSNHPLTDQAFVASEVHGTWGKAEEVPGLAALNTGGAAYVYSVSCAAPGNCSAGGRYTGSSSHFGAFVVSEVNGTWGKAEQVPGLAALNKGRSAEVDSVSCVPAGPCTAGGVSAPSGPSYQQPFVVSRHGAVGRGAEARNSLH